MTVTEAAQRLGVSTARVHQLATEGRLDRAARGLVTVATVTRLVTSRVVVDRPGAVTLAAAAERLGLSVRRVREYLAAGRLDRAAPGLVTVESVERVRVTRPPRVPPVLAGMRSLSTAEAAGRLGVSVRRVRQMVAAGILTRSARGRVTVASVDRESGTTTPPTVDPPVPVGAVTLAAAAERLGLSVPRVSGLRAVGRLDRAGPGLVTAASVTAEREWRAGVRARPRVPVDPGRKSTTIEDAAGRLGVGVRRVRQMVAERVLTPAGPGLVTVASVDAEVAERQRLAGHRSGGDVLTTADAADRLGLSVDRVRRLVTEGALDRPAPGYVTRASVDREVARRVERAAARAARAADRLDRLDRVDR